MTTGKGKKMKYRETPLFSERYRAEYYEGIQRVIEERYERAREERTAAWRDFPGRMEEHRRRAAMTLGWPLTEYQAGAPEARYELLSREEGYSVYRLTVYPLPGLPFSGLLFLREGDAARPLAVALHGNEGTPEMCAEVAGPSYNYNRMTERLLDCGVHVYSPQTLMWKKETWGAAYDRRGVDEALKYLGGSVDGLEIYCVRKALDALCQRGDVDNGALGACGLSYGGLYAMLLAAVDTRVRAVLSAGRFVDSDFEMNRLRRGGDTQDVWFGSALHLTLVEMAMLCWPRTLIVSMARGDRLVPFELAEKAMEEVRERTEGVDDGSWVRFLPFEGEHEFDRSDAPIEELMSALGWERKGTWRGRDFVV